MVLYLHGGGYCIGSLDTHRSLAGRIAVAAGCPVVTLDYRLGPEHPFPAAVTMPRPPTRTFWPSGSAPNASPSPVTRPAAG